MSSAACYTNRRRVIAESSLRKVQYPGRIVVNNDKILSVQNCNPQYDIINYASRICCNKKSKYNPDLTSNPFNSFFTSIYSDIPSGNANIFITNSPSVANTTSLTFSLFTSVDFTILNLWLQLQNDTHKETVITFENIVYNIRSYSINELSREFTFNVELIQSTDTTFISEKIYNTAFYINQI